jgi:succinate dehydrogenase / fumarate reductase flavoprotein subunit
MIKLAELETYEHDVLIIGAGGAGLRAAIECSIQGLNTGVIGKSMLGKAHTVMAEGGMAAALGNVDPRDNWIFHFRDTMRGGKFLNQWEMAAIHAQQAPERVHELERWGAVFDRTHDGLISQRNFGGHRFPRLAHVGDRTGLELIRTLQNKTVHEKNVLLHNNGMLECTALELLTDNGQISGVLAYWREKGTFVIFKVKAVILATGGLGKAWRINSNSWEYTGDGISMAYRAGAVLKDMEFIQYHPTGMVWPNSVKGILVTEGIRGEGGILLNNKGERFMFNYIPERFAKETAETEEEAEKWLKGDKNAKRPPELLTRDVVARAIMAEVKEGRGSPHGGVFLDVSSRLPADVIRKKLPAMYHQFKELAQLDITKDPMEVGPTTHYSMGGIKVDSYTQQTNISGLFACGECAAGLHGANRLGGNSLTDLLVFGRLAGIGAAKYINSMDNTPQISETQVNEVINECLDILNRETGTNPYIVHEKLQDIMNDYVGLARSEEDLNKALFKIINLKEEVSNIKAYGTSQFNPGWSEALDLKSLILCSEAVIRSALTREESRGGHSRIDFPQENNEWLNINIEIKKGKEGMELTKVQRPEAPEKLKEIAYSSLEDLEKLDFTTPIKIGEI